MVSLCSLCVRAVLTQASRCAPSAAASSASIKQRLDLAKLRLKLISGDLEKLQAQTGEPGTSPFAIYGRGLIEIHAVSMTVSNRAMNRHPPPIASRTTASP